MTKTYFTLDYCLALVKIVYARDTQAKSERWRSCTTLPVVIL